MAKFIIFVIGLIVGLAILGIHNFLKNDYIIEEALLSPDGKYLATRFQEVGRFVFCWEVVVVSPSDKYFSINQIAKYVQFQEFGDDCGTYAKIQWENSQQLNIYLDADYLKRMPAAQMMRKSPLANQFAVKFLPQVKQ